MEDNFRNTLIILSAIVIAAIFIHGYWTIRKQKNPYKLKTKDEPVIPQSRGFDGSGFDQDGVSKPKVVSANSQRDAVSTESHIQSSAAEFQQNTAMTSDAAIKVNEDNIGRQELNLGAVHNESASKPDHKKQQYLAEELSHEEDFFFESDVNETVQAQDKIEKSVPYEPVYQQPVTQAKPEVLVNKSAARKNNVRNTKIKRNQMEINFGGETVKDMPSMSATTPIDKPAPIEIAPQVIVLSVVMPEGQVMSGAALLPSLLTLGMKYGEMNIFHRHQDNAGNGKVTFSLANMMNPGTFNLDDIENFSTQGITLFMTLPNPGDAFAVFEQMLNAAKQLAVEFRGQLLDDKRSVMTKQTEQHYIGIIREFERKSRIGSL